jgi:hypothetical protein
VLGLTSTNLPEVAAPNATDEVVDLAVTVPEAADTAAEVLRAVFAFSVTFTGADNAAEIVTVDAVELISMLPAVEVRDAPELVIAAEPERVMVPLARIAPVGCTEVPPLILTIPADAVRAPDPAYAPVGFIKIEPADEVTAAFCVSAPP